VTVTYIKNPAFARMNKKPQGGGRGGQGCVFSLRGQ